MLVDEALALLPPNNILLFIVEEIALMSKGSFLKPVNIEPINHFSLPEASPEACNVSLLPSVVALTNLS